MSNHFAEIIKSLDFWTEFHRNTAQERLQESEGEAKNSYIGGVLYGAWSAHKSAADILTNIRREVEMEYRYFREDQEHLKNKLNDMLTHRHGEKS